MRAPAWRTDVVLVASGAAPADLPLSLAEQILTAYPNEPCEDPPADIGCTVEGAPFGAQWRRSVAYYGGDNAPKYGQSVLTTI